MQVDKHLLEKFPRSDINTQRTDVHNLTKLVGNGSGRLDASSALLLLLPLWDGPAAFLRIRGKTGKADAAAGAPQGRTLARSLFQRSTEGRFFSLEEKPRKLCDWVQFYFLEFVADRTEIGDIDSAEYG